MPRRDDAVECVVLALCREWLKLSPTTRGVKALSVLKINGMDFHHKFVVAKPISRKQRVALNLPRGTSTRGRAIEAMPTTHTLI
jgi:hypothetical protein